MPATTVGIAAGTTAAAAWNASMVSLAVGTMTGLAGTLMQSKQAAGQAKAQQAQANYQSRIAEKNAELARQQEGAQLRQAYENSLQIKRKAASVIGSQRAASGASGLATDYGSLLDVQEESAMNAARDAAAVYNRGVDQAYNTELQAWGYDQQTQGYSLLSDSYGSQARAARTAGLINAGSDLIGGIAKAGTTYWDLRAKYPTSFDIPDSGGYYDTNTGTNAGAYGTRRYVQPRADGSFSFYR